MNNPALNNLKQSQDTYVTVNYSHDEQPSKCPEKNPLEPETSEEEDLDLPQKDAQDDPF